MDFRFILENFALTFFRGVPVFRSLVVPLAKSRVERNRPDRLSNALQATEVMVEHHLKHGNSTRADELIVEFMEHDAMFERRGIDLPTRTTDGLLVVAIRNFASIYNQFDQAPPGCLLKRARWLSEQYGTEVKPPSSEIDAEEMTRWAGRFLNEAF